MPPEQKNELSTARKIADLVEEYDAKIEAIDDNIATFHNAVSEVQMQSTVAGAFGEPLFRYSPNLSSHQMKKRLLLSAWNAAFDMLQLSTLATAKDKKLFKMAMQNPAPFSFDNVKATFGHYVEDPYMSILRGMAEVFCSLDPAYKSHSNVKIGVKGLPKRIIFPCSQYNSYGRERLHDMLTALKVFDGDGVVDYSIFNNITSEKISKYRGLEFRFYQNGNVHVIFDIHARNQINRALAAYYGEVLPDVEIKTDKRQSSTKVSKDLQYYPTPISVADSLVGNIYIRDDQKILEPSCGCGRLIDAIKRSNPRATVHAIEYDASKAHLAREKGHSVLIANFLEQPANPIYDIVFMNPPFYGKHYLKHIKHALGFLKDGGTLYAILPATAHYDHKMLPDGYRWRDLPVGSFSESGTNVPTGYMELSK